MPAHLVALHFSFPMMCLIHTLLSVGETTTQLSMDMAGRRGAVQSGIHISVDRCRGGCPLVHLAIYPDHDLLRGGTPGGLPVLHATGEHSDCCTPFDEPACEGGGVVRGGG
jgi:hypothetical protein